MKDTGVNMRCDRCGRQVFYKYEAFGLSIADQIEDDGWCIRADVDLCAECTKAYDEMLKRFLNEVWDK